VDVPYSRLKVAIVQALQREGFVWDHEVVDAGVHKVLRVNLKYGPNGEHVIQHVERVSKPGCRVYVAVNEMKDVRQGTGISVLSTSKGVLSNREARREGIGGELLCEVW
jgi:small subunit ribosomal protein S8